MKRLQMSHKQLPTKQHGVTLIVAMVMLLILMMFSVSLAGMAIMSEKAARNERDKQVALQAAESALVDAEMDIENSSSATSRSTIFSTDSAQGFSEECGKGDDNIFQGLCMTTQAAQAPIWMTVDITNTDGEAVSVPFGRFTGQTLPHGASLFTVQLPRYLIELMPDHSTGHAAKAVYMYRITAVGFGTDRKTQVVLQSFYRKAGI